jgi:hypothetical protein
MASSWSKSVLLSFAVKFGRAYPSHATIAKLACCSERTVANALSWLRMFGFLSWQRRLKHTSSRLGVVVRQTSNAYRLALSGLAAISAAMLRGGSERNNCRPSRVYPPRPSSPQLTFEIQAAE